MARLSIFFCLTLFFIISIPSAAPDQFKEDKVYIVYMGGKRSSSPGTLRDDQAHLLKSFSERNAVVHVYKHGFTGFAARMSKEEANLIGQHPGVVSVFPDKKVKLLTTRSWSFLQQLSNITLSRSTSTAKGADTIIGIMDTGIWPESKSFSDENMGPVPKRWKGTCVETHDFPASSCNRKLVGARHFDDRNKSCRDFDGHGTHTASTAAGAPVPGVSYYGLAEGTAIGGSPSSRIAVYKICYEFCDDSAILAGMDAAIHDGVDIMSLSIGGDPEDSEILDDSLAIGGFHAIEHGITVVCAGGNDGPYESSVSNFTPWLTTVAASTIDRHFEANVVLGNNQKIKGGCIVFPGLSESPIYPLIDGLSAKSASPETPDSASKNCLPGSLDGSKINGKIVLCFNEEENSGKVRGILGQGGLGVILVDDGLEIASMQPRVVDFTLTSISSNDGNDVLSYIKSNRNPTATILRSATSVNYKPAPSIADFSSRGPSSYLTHNLLKPDISAPGVNIIAAWRGMDNSKAIPGRKSPEYVIESGTSMATPHISGVAALVKSQHPTWDHSAIRSAIMTTAIQTDSDGAPITKLPGLQKATPYDFGAGEVNIAQAIDPGLIYETSTMDYYIFLCNIGYNESQIKLIAGKMPQEFSCPKDASEDLISNMNYPSIAVANFNKTMYKKVTRTVTNVGDEDETVYSVTVDPPQYLNVQVIPEKLEFTKENKKKSFDVIFSTEYHYQSDVFGWITWSNGKYRVRSPFAISINNSRR